MILWFYEKKKIVIKVRSKLQQDPNSEKKKKKESSVEQAPEIDWSPVKQHFCPITQEKLFSSSTLSLHYSGVRTFLFWLLPPLYTQTWGVRNSRILRFCRHMAIKYYGKLLHWLETSQWNKNSLDKVGGFFQQCIGFSTVITAKALTDQASEINSVLFCSTDTTTASY